MKAQVASAALSQQKQLVEKYEAQIADLRQQLSISQSEVNTARIQCSITEFQLRNASSSLSALENSFQEKAHQLALSQADVVSISTDNRNFLTFVNNIRTRFLPDFPRLSTSNFADSSRLFLEQLVARLPASWVSIPQQDTQLRAQLDELESANREYARDLRELQRRTIQQEIEIQTLKAAAKDSRK